ncbi:hypothetical protein E4O04_12880 [Treponema sp. OMZ 799]|uniref:hypothetical protein n=1 Tax=Treponema sp. OMZ 799 TaxID=2563668 RepID=UPI0020A2BF61|nr:hypothetical protein [Treponema sp. OMZ 799]UTC78842.1 hypothetical protein E4O04_12880 [Treponema sp. OMZ 799]
MTKNDNLYNAYDGKNNAFHALADNSARQAIFRIDDESFEKKIIAYKKAAYEEGAISIETKKIFENCNIITLSYLDSCGNKKSYEKYCWQYDISFENAHFFASLMGSETLLYKDGNKIIVYKSQTPQSIITLYPESNAFEKYGIKTIFEMMFWLLGSAKNIVSISVPKAIFLQRVQYKYLRGAGMRIPRKSYTELMESAPFIYINNENHEHRKKDYAEYIPPEEDRYKTCKTKSRCRRLIKNSGVLFLCNKEQVDTMKKHLDELTEEWNSEYKSLTFQFLTEDENPEQIIYSGFYVFLDHAINGRENMQSLSAAARKAGISVTLYVPSKDSKTIQIISTEDSKPIFTLKMEDGYELLSILVPFLKIDDKGKRFWDMKYCE